MYTDLHLKYSLTISVRFQWNLNFLNTFSKSTQIPNFMKMRPVGAELLHVDGQTDRHDEAKSRFPHFCRKSGQTSVFSDNWRVLNAAIGANYATDWLQPWWLRLPEGTKPWWLRLPEGTNVLSLEIIDYFDVTWCNLVHNCRRFWGTCYLPFYCQILPISYFHSNPSNHKISELLDAALNRRVNCSIRKYKILPKTYRLLFVVTFNQPGVGVRTCVPAVQWHCATPCDVIRHLLFDTNIKQIL